MYGPKRGVGCPGAARDEEGSGKSPDCMLMVAAVIGRRKTAAYVGLVALFSVCAGLLYGAWVDGLGWLPLSLALGLFVAVLAAGLTWLRHRQRRAAAA